MSVDLDLGLWPRKRVALIRQVASAECGLASLAMVTNFHGYAVDLGTLRRRFPPSVRGSTLRDLISAADQLCFNARALKVPLDTLSQLPLPAILHWDMNHFVVLEKATSSKALIHDPRGYSRWLRMEEVSDHFTGVVLEIEPANDFTPVRHREKLRLRQLWGKLEGYKRAITQTVVLSIVMQAFVLASPYYAQIAIDSALPALDHSLLAVLALGFGLFTVIYAVSGLLRSLVLLSAGMSIGYGIAVNIARRLFRLPLSWFERRRTADVLSRFQSVAPIRQFLTEDAVGATVDGVLAVLTLAMMFLYSARLAIVALVALGSYILLRRLTFVIQRRTQEDSIETSAREQTILIESLQGMTTLRLYGSEAARHALWRSRLIDTTNADIRLARIAAWQQSGSSLILGLETIMSLWIAIGLVMNGGFSLGMVFAFTAYKTQFLQSGTSLVKQAVSFKMLGLHLDRLADIALAVPDVSFTSIEPPPRDLDGQVTLRDIHFRYAPTDPLVLDGLDLSIERGEYVAITGPSGGGKSTLLKLLLGLRQPESGAVLIDGQSLEQFGHRNYHRQIGAVLQDDILFAGTLADNIALFDDSPDRARIQLAAQMAAISDDIAAMPLSYDTPIGDMGSTLSGGQQQRLLLARALYRQPRLLVMDEGTSHLDVGREQMVNSAISELGITRIIVAHRRETILAADRILLLEHGRLSDATKQYKPGRSTAKSAAG